MVKRMGSMGTKTVHFDFNKPAHVSKFLSGLWVGSTQITGVAYEKTGWKEFTDMTDEQRKQCASELWSIWMVRGSKMRYKEPTNQ